ncbi:MAG TPA: PQQ-binding-like beta-propeller repeat protein [Pirellulales bacterium]|jgi:outer membrane protein assembly factor BamB
MRHGGFTALGVAGRILFAVAAIFCAQATCSVAFGDDEKPASQQAVTEKPAAEKPAAEKPAAEKAPADKPAEKVIEGKAVEAQKAAQDAKAAAKEAALKAAKKLAEKAAPAPPGAPAPAIVPALPGGIRAMPAIRRIGVIRPGGQPQEGSDADPVFFPTDRATMQRLTKAQELLEQKRFGEAVRLLGEILEGPEDYFFQPKRDEPIHRSLKSEAQRLIGQLPEEGRESYELQYGATAQQKLDVAIAAGDGAALAEVSRRFFHTKAGYDATNLLAGWQLDHGHPLAAALTLKRLQSAPAAQQFEPTLTVRMAACWSRAGMADKAAEALAALPQKYRDAKIHLAGKQVAVFDRNEDAGAWLVKQVGPPPKNVVSAGDQWAMYRGVPSRNAVSAGSSPLLNRRWGVPTSDKDGAIEGMVKQLRQTALDQGTTMLPTLHPLAVNDHVFMRSIGGLVAINFTTGKRVWRGPEDESIRQMLEPNAQFASVSRPTVMGGRRLIPNTAVPLVPNWLTQRIWNDTTYGTMSSDGQRIFCIEDLDVGTGVFDQRQIVMMNGRMPQQAAGARSYNRLAAYDIATEGKLKWDIGGPTIDGGSELAGAFFLGPPLPLGGSVYALAEVKGEIRLVVLEAATGKLVWSQQLAVLEANIMQDPSRRSSGVSPSYSDGVLVCPTSAGATVALDLTTRSLLWGYQFTRNEAMPGMTGMNGRVIINGQIVMNAAQGASRWSDSSVTIADGYVLLTPPESNQLHCLSLLDGKLLWQRSREDGLYVGCVSGDKALVVGRNSVRALKLADGSSAWTDASLALPAGSAPSGRGFYNGKRYLLPLTSAEVAAIDVENGRVVGRSKSRTGTIPGNLICYRGAVISQGVDVIERFDQRDDLWKQISETLSATPDDAEALARRGELLLDEGNFAEAVQSLRRSFELQPKPHTRELLVDAMLEGLRIDFVANRGWVADVEKLVDQPQQRGAFLRLLAAGLQAAGEEFAAFEAYMQLVDAETQRSELERVDHVLSVRKDRWVQARLRGLIEAASPEERAKMETAVAARLATANDAAGVAPLRHFLDFFSTLPVAESARDRLAQRLIEQRSLLEAEQLLQYAERSSDAKRAVAATARVAALVDSAGRYDDATLYYKRLTERFGEAEGLGRQLVGALPEKSEVVKLLNAPPAWPIGEVKRDEAKGQPGVRNPNFPIPLVGPLGVFYEHMGIELDQQSQAIVGKDSFGRERWRVPLRDPAQNNLIVFPMLPQTSQARVNGHLLLVSMGYQILAIDTLGGPGGEGARVLWRQDLVENAAGANLNFGGNQYVQVPWAVPRMIPMDQLGRPLGSMGPLTSNMACFQRLRNVVVLHPISGETLWTRGNVEPGSDLFGDDEMLFIVAPNTDDALVVRALDGYELGRRKTPPSNQRVTTIGRRAVSWGVEDGKSVLKMTDIWDQKEIWKWQFDPAAKPWLVADESVGVFSPDGRFLLIGLADGKAMVDELVTPEPQLNEVFVMRGSDQYILIANHPPQMRNGVNLQPVPGQIGNPLVAGNVHLFDRKTGKKIASTPIDKQGLLLSQPSGLPVLTFATQIYNQQRTPQIPQVQTEVKFLDKRTGRIVYEEKLSNQILAVDLIGDPERNQVVLKTPGSGIRLTFTGKPVSDGKAEENKSEASKGGEAGAKTETGPESDASRAGKAVARGLAKWFETVPSAVPARTVPVTPRMVEPKRVAPAEGPAAAPVPAPAPAADPPPPAPAPDKK